MTWLAKPSNPQRFDRCYETGKTLGFSGGRLNDGMRTIVRMVLHTGGSVADLREADFLEMHDGAPPGRSTTARRGAGVEHLGARSAY